MTLCTTKRIDFTRCNGRKIRANLDGERLPEMGVLCMSPQADRAISLTEPVTAIIRGPRWENGVRV